MSPSVYRQRPRFIAILGWWFALAAVIGPAVLLFSLFGHADSYTINDVPVSRDQFLQFIRPLVLPLSLLALVAGVAAWMLWTERRIGRVLATAALILSVAGGGLAPSIHQPWQLTVILAAIVGLPCVWYFYRKPNVVAYYESLGSSARPNEEL